MLWLIQPHNMRTFQAITNICWGFKLLLACKTRTSSASIPSLLHSWSTYVYPHTLISVDIIQVYLLICLLYWLMKQFIKNLSPFKETKYLNGLTSLEQTLPKRPILVSAHEPPYTEWVYVLYLLSRLNCHLRGYWLQQFDQLMDAGPFSFMAQLMCLGCPDIMGAHYLSTFICPGMNKPIKPSALDIRITCFIIRTRFLLTMLKL